MTKFKFPLETQTGASMDSSHPGELSIEAPVCVCAYCNRWFILHPQGWQCGILFLSFTFL